MDCSSREGRCSTGPQPLPFRQDQRRISCRHQSSRGEDGTTAGEFPRNPCCRSSDRRPKLDRDSPRRKSGNAVTNPRIIVVHRRLQVPSSPLHDPPRNPTHASTRGGAVSYALAEWLFGVTNRPERVQQYRSRKWNYSITSSARAISEGGTVRPSSFAALRLMTRLSLVACSTGRSLGLAPRSTLST